MTSRHLFALPAVALLSAACQSTEQPQELIPVSSPTNAMALDSATPLAPIAAGPVVSPVASSQTPTMPRPDSGANDGGAAVVTLAPDAAAQGDTGAANDSAVNGARDDAASAVGDAALPVGDAASMGDASAMADASPPVSPTGTCGGSTPHGCWPPKAGNPMGCPAQIHEQSEYYPPLDEWVACESPYYERCLYLRPDGMEAYCACDLGVHWLCVY